MKRIGILTAGGDTPALNATIKGAVLRACELRVEVVGLIKGFSALFNPHMPHVFLNPLFMPIPELDETRGGTCLGASRDYLNPDDKPAIDDIIKKLRRLGIEGLVCVGGDGTLNGLQPLADELPTVLAPKTIDNDLGLNYRGETEEWSREPSETKPGYKYQRRSSRNRFSTERMINYATPGYATSVFVSAGGVQRIRTTAESHRRIGIVEVMGRHSGYIALGSAYGQPDFTLIPESPVDINHLVERVKETYEYQKNVVIVCGEGIVGPNGMELGAEKASTDPSGNLILNGASDALRWQLIEAIGDDYFRSKRRAESAQAAIFTRKVGHTQRGGRPIQFDRFFAAQLGAKAVSMLLEGQNNAVSILQYNEEKGFHVDSIDANAFRDRWGLIHARNVHPDLYDAENMRPSPKGVEYLLPIFSHAIGNDDVENIRQTLFDSGNLIEPYQSVNVAVNKRIRYIDDVLSK